MGCDNPSYLSYTTRVLNFPRTMVALVQILFNCWNDVAPLKPSSTHSTSFSFTKCFAVMLGFFIKYMYCAVVISLLSVPFKTPKPENLEDLATKFNDMKITIVKGASADHFIQGSIQYPKLKSRIEFYSYTDGEEAHQKIMDDVLSGQRVIVEVTNCIHFSHLFQYFSAFLVLYIFYF